MPSVNPPSQGREETDQSESDHFSDASEGRGSESDIPTTRVERVDDQPSHGEVPGTDAYEKRKGDAEPDELEVIPEKPAEGGVPQLIVEKVDPDVPSHGEVPGTYAHELRKADAEPDQVREASAIAKADLEGRYSIDPQFYKTPRAIEPTSDRYPPQEPALGSPSAGVDATQDTDFALTDDFDDFEEGNEAADDDDDFGGFDEGTEAEDSIAATHTIPDAGPELPALDPSLVSSFLPVNLSVAVDIDEKNQPPLDFSGLTSYEDIAAALQPYIDDIFPEDLRSQSSSVDSLSEVNPKFLTERSKSLWGQLVAPPPLQPPNWVKSRIRRLFLVSLGVPVDLDEILPASKQKKLVLPSLEDAQAQAKGNERPSTDTANAGAKQGDSTTASPRNSSSGAAGLSSKADRSKRRGPPPAPDFDIHAARLLCLTTVAALQGLTLTELKVHRGKLSEYRNQAVAVLEHWQQQRDKALGDKEAFEEVIENLVKHAKRIRK